MKKDLVFFYLFKIKKEMMYAQIMSEHPDIFPQEEPEEEEPPPLPSRSSKNGHVSFSNKVDIVVVEGMGNPPKHDNYAERSSAHFGNKKV